MGLREWPAGFELRSGLRNAWDRAAWLLFHDFVDVRVEQRVEMSVWTLASARGTRAQDGAWEASALSLVTTRRSSRSA